MSALIFQILGIYLSVYIMVVVSMNKKGICLIMSVIMVLQLCMPNFLYASNDKNPICSAPSQGMSLYYQFQNDAITALLGSELDSKRFAVSLSNDWLFSKNVLSLRTGSISAIDMVSSSVMGNLRSLASSSMTIMSLLILTSLQVGRSNTEGLSILWQNRAIVRDYKTLLEIETKLMNLAYYLSDKVDLLGDFEGNIIERLNDVISKYQDLGVLDEYVSINTSASANLNDIFSDLIEMNSSMKSFILVGRTKGVGNVNGTYTVKGIEDVCTNNSCHVLIGFDDDFINQLIEDYSDARVFWTCNVNFSSFASDIAKGFDNNIEGVEDSADNVKRAFDRLLAAFTNKNSDTGETKKDRCDMSAYEMARLRAYRGGNWTCDDSIVNGNVSIGSITNEDYSLMSLKKSIKSAEKKSNSTLKKETKNQDKQERKEVREKNREKRAQEKEQKKQSRIEWSDCFNSAKSLSERQYCGYLVYGTEDFVYNSAFSSVMYDEMIADFSDNVKNYESSISNAMFANMNDQLINIMALISQIDELSNLVGNKSTGLKGVLDNINAYQCAG